MRVGLDAEARSRERSVAVLSSSAEVPVKRLHGSGADPHDACAVALADLRHRGRGVDALGAVWKPTASLQVEETLGSLGKAHRSYEQPLVLPQVPQT